MTLRSKTLDFVNRILLCQQQQQLCIPKLELHAHLNGSIPIATLRRFAEEDKNTAVMEELRNFTQPLPSEASDKERMAHCFIAFDCVFKLMTTRQRVYDGTRAMIASFIAEGVVYLEVRTTPKSLADGSSDEQYVQTVIDGCQDEVDAFYAASDSDAAAPPSCRTPVERGIRVNLLLTVNRRNSADAGERVVDLALKFRDQQQQLRRKGTTSSSSSSSARRHIVGLVGIDFAGDTYDPKPFAAFLPALVRAQKHSFPLTIHCGEREDDAEVKQMLLLAPARLGHCVFVSPGMQQLIRSAQVPLELCLTSNMVTGGLKSTTDHHITDYMGEQDHPIAINTDDFCVFQTSLNKELLLFAEIVFDLMMVARRNRGGEEQIEEKNGGSVKQPREQDSSTATTTVMQIARAVLHQVWRVQFVAARSAFCGDHEEQVGLISMMMRCHEEFMVALDATKCE